MLRWRRKFSWRIATIRACEHTPVDEMQHKAYFIKMAVANFRPPSHMHRNIPYRLFCQKCTPLVATAAPVGARRASTSELRVPPARVG